MKRQTSWYQNKTKFKTIAGEKGFQIHTNSPNKKKTESNSVRTRDRQVDT